MAEALRVTRSCTIPLDEFEWRFTAAGGPGGQHANTSNTRVDLRFDVEASPSLLPHQRDRLLRKLGGVVRVTAADERSQVRNKAVALERMRGKLAEALAVERARTPTKPTRGAKERRLDEKRRRSETKRRRQGDPGD